MPEGVSEGGNVMHEMLCGLGGKDGPCEGWNGGNMGTTGDGRDSNGKVRDKNMRQQNI